QNQILAILGASAKNMLEYIRTHDVDVFSIHKESRGCHNLLNVPRPSQSLSGYWDDIESGLQAPDFILGLFLPTSIAQKFQLERSAILVRTDADRWTLAHELMHFLFSDVRS